MGKFPMTKWLTSISATRVRRVPRGLLLLLFLGAAVGCSEGARPEGDATSEFASPGVSPEPACEISLALERGTRLPAVSLPATEGDALNYDAVRFVRLMADGGAVVASRTLPRLTFFDGTGDRVWRVGRPGAGPGDFWAIDRLWVMPGDTLRVLDLRAMSESRFTPEGDLLERRALEVHFGRGVTPISPLADGRWVVAEGSGTGSIQAPDRGLRQDSLSVTLWDAQGRTLDTLAHYVGALRLGDMSRFLETSQALMVTVPFQGETGVRVVGDTLLVISDGREGFLTLVHIGSRAQTRVTVPDASRPIPQEEVDGWIRDYLERQTPPVRAWVGPQIQELPFPGRTPVYDGVGIAWDGAREVFWVPEHRPPDPAADTLRVSIVDVNGVVHGRVELPGFRRILEVRDDRAVAVEVSGSGEDTVWVIPVVCARRTAP